MIIRNNISLINISDNLKKTTDRLEKSKYKIASKSKVSISDDAVGLAISEKLNTQIRALNQTNTNAQNTISLIQTAEGALNGISNIISTMRDLAVQASNDSNTYIDRKSIQDEINNLTEEIDRIAKKSEYNTLALFSGTLHVNTDVGIDVELGEISAKNLGLTSNVNSKELPLNISNHSNASNAIKSYDNAVMTIASERSKLGAFQNRLHHSINFADKATENLVDGGEKLKEVDFTKEIINTYKDNIIKEFSQSIYVQTKNNPESILNLLSKL